MTQQCDLCRQREARTASGLCLTCLMDLISSLETNAAQNDRVIRALVERAEKQVRRFVAAEN